jgi:hypothetical protein
VCRAHDEAAQARIVEAYTRALGTVAAAMASADPQAYLEVPRLPIERRTVVPSETQL